MLQIDLKRLPTSDELLGSDDTPVDNEDQNFVPNVLLFLLEYIWKNRDDWYFGVDMGIYHTKGLNPHSARNGSLKIFTTRQSGFQRFQKKLMIINPISVSLLTILK